MTVSRKVFTQAPCAALRPFVKRFLVVDYPSLHRDSHLPGTGTVAAFRLQGDCFLQGGQPAPAAGLTGLWDAPRSHEHGPGNRVALVQFTPTGAAALVPASLDEFGNATIPLGSVLRHPDDLLRLHERLQRAPTHAQRIRLLEAFLLQRLAGARPDPLMTAAVTWIQDSPAETRIAALTRHIGLSQSALERRFRRAVGVTPRRFASLVRLQHVLRLHRPGMSLAALAQAAGYFDQSHFIHDFRRFAGSAPGAYFAATG